MRTQQAMPQLQQDAPYMFQRLERVKERFATNYLQHYLDASRKSWYVRLTATYLSQHLLEEYRHRVEDIAATMGPDAITPPMRQRLTVLTTATGITTVQLALDAIATEDVYTMLARTLEASDHVIAWSTMDRRLATDISTWALEQVHHKMGTETIAVMSDSLLEETLMTYVWAQDPDILHDRVHHFLTRTAQHIAFDLAATIESRPPSLAELEHLLGFREGSPSLTRLQPLLREEHLTVMNTSHYQAVREAMYKNTFQRLDGIPWPTALLAKGTAHGHAQLRPVIMDTQPLIPPEEIEAWSQRMWQQRGALSDLDADALDALSALWLYQARTPQEDAVADVDELLAMRGLQAKQNGQGRRGGYEPEQRAAMLQALAHIQNLWMDMSELDVYEEARTGTRRRTSTRQAIQSRAFTITDLFGQIRLDGGMDVQKFIFRPGKVFAHFLFGPGRQTALLSAQTLHYDPLRQTWEKRLGRYLSYQWRCKAHAGDYLQPFRVATLLDAVGVDVDARKPSRTRERLEKALDALQRNGVIATWQYDRWDEALTTRRGWAQHWRQATILIEPPEAIRDLYQRLERHETPLPKALLSAAAFGKRIKRWRKALGLSQIQAAEQLGIHQGYLSRLERGKARRLSTIQKRLAQWLAEIPDAPIAPEADHQAEANEAALHKDAE